MGLESGEYISDLEPANPASTDQLNEADDHIRLIKKTILNSFPNIDGAVNATPAQIDQLVDNNFDSTITEEGVEVAKLSGATFTGPVYDDGNNPTADAQLVNKQYADSALQAAYPPYPAVAKHVYGRINANGTISKSGGGFTVVKGVAGYWTVNLNPSITQSYTVVASSAQDQPANTVNVFSESPSSFQVSNRYAGGSGEGRDIAWSFILTYYE